MRIHSRRRIARRFQMSGLSSTEELFQRNLIYYEPNSRSKVLFSIGNFYCFKRQEPPRTQSNSPNLLWLIVYTIFAYNAKQTILSFIRTFNLYTMDFIIDNHLQGLVIGICTFLIIGMFHPIVVKAEYYWSTRCWWLFLFLGIAGVISSLCTENVVISSLLGVFAFSSFWSIKEIFEQEKRVQKGWFPKNPKRTYKF